MSDRASANPGTGADPGERRLESWKEIAAYLGRDVTTAQRWEKYEGLPVHRLHHGKLGSVYAYTTELDAWRDERASGPRADRLNSRQGTSALRRAGAVVLVVLALSLAGGLVWFLRQRTATPKIESLAVLPLENLSRDPEQEYFADGMTEALITELSKVRALKVISRTSAMRYKKTNKPMPQIAHELGVDGLIEGSVQREGDQVRITVQLTHGPTDKHVWADSYQRELRGVLALQGEVARDIARQIQATLTPLEENRLRGGQEIDPATYQAYLKGLYYLSGPDPQSWLTASHYFEEAVAKEPDWAMAHAMLGRSYHWYASSPQGRKEYWEKSRQALLRALALDDGLAKAHSSLGFVLSSHDWDWVGAEKEFRRAEELDPNEEHGYSLLLMNSGRFEEAITRMRRAEAADPLHLALKANVGFVYTCAGQPDKAIAQLQSVLELKPDYDYAYEFLFQAYLRKSAYPEALAALEKYREFGGDEIGYKLDLAHAYARMGRRQEALLLLSQLKDAPPAAVAQDYAALVDTEKALSLLERAYQEHDQGLLFLRCWPEYEQLRPHPRFQALLRRMNFPE